MPFVGPTVVSTAAAAVARRTFGDLKAELARAYNADDVETLALAGDALNEAIREYNRYAWPWEILTADLSLVSGTETYALPQPFKKPLSCFFLSSSRPDKRIDYQPYESFVNGYNLKSDGEPRVYTLQNTFETGQVTFFPRPSSTYSVRLWYYRRTPVMQLDGTPLEVPPECEEAFLLWADYRLDKKLKGTASMIELKRVDAMQARNELVQMVSQRGDTVGYV